MNKILLVGEHSAGRLSPMIPKCVTCARAIPESEITLVLFGSDTAAVAAQAAELEGVARVLRVDGPAFEHPLAAVLAPQLVAMAGGYSHLLGASTTFGKDLMPRVAALLDVPQISDVAAVVSAMQFKRPIYAGNVIATVSVPAGQKVVMTVRTASYQPCGAGGHASIESVAATAAVPGHTRYVSTSSAVSDRPELQSAARVVSGGRALGSAENFKILFQLADRMGAAVGASRAAVDAGYAANDMQVGQTGKIIAPELYMAVGISGAIQHLTGIKDARTIVAINKDPEAPIFEVADVGLVADLFQVVPELESLLAAK